VLRHRSTASFARKSSSIIIEGIARGAIGASSQVEPRSPERWIARKRGKPHAPLREPSAPSRNPSAHCAMAASGFAKSTPISHGKGRKPVLVARLGHPALTATAPTTNRCGYRKDLKRMPTEPLELPPKVERARMGT
jgi:hypothetical protein